MVEDMALDYLTSESGFNQDLGLWDFNQPPHPSMFAASEQPSQTAALTSHPSQSASRFPSGHHFFRPDDFMIAPRAPPFSARRREGGQEAEASGSVNPVVTGFDFSGPSSYRPAAFPSQIPVLEGISPPRRVPIPSTTNGPASGEFPKKQTTLLVLSRATEESIEALDEHKRECPTCCLDFEPDTFVALITCCSMAIHVRCFSAYVNSQGYSKNRVCMKCRRGIDAKYVLNKVFPPVTDKDWDEGRDFDAPESLAGDAKMELNVTARPSRTHHHRSRPSGGDGGHRGGRYFSMVNHMNSEQRLAFLHLREDQVQKLEEMRARRQAALENSTRLSHEDLEANRALVEEQHRATHEQVTAMLERTRETRAAREVARASYEKTQAEWEAMQLTQERRLNDMVEVYHVEREIREREVLSRMEPLPPPRSAPIPIPQLRVVNGEPSDNSSS